MSQDGSGNVIAFKANAHIGHTVAHKVELILSRHNEKELTFHYTSLDDNSTFAKIGLIFDLVHAAQAESKRLASALLNTPEVRGLFNR